MAIPLGGPLRLLAQTWFNKVECRKPAKGNKIILWSIKQSPQQRIEKNVSSRQRFFYPSINYENKYTRKTLN